MSIQQKSNAGKYSLAGAIVAAVCIGIYLFALIQAAVRIYLSVEERKFTAETEFAHIADTASSAGVLGFMDESFVETMNDALASSKTIEALIISGPEGEYAFERQKGRAVAWVNNSPRFINRFDFSRQNLYMPLRIMGLRNVNIQAVAGSIDNSAFSGILKETLFLILLGLVIAFFTMLIHLLAKSGERNSAPAPVYVQDAPAGEIEENIVDEISGPRGLYSPRSKIGWEEHAKDRLESELHRCASTEEDVVLIVMEIMNRIDDVKYRKAAAEAASFFSLKDMLFEYGSQGISIIYPGVDLETALTKSREFQRRVTEKISDYKKANTVCMGLSSRSGRLLNAGRMILEATEALRRAKKESNSSIIAFKSDPEKYRAFIAGQISS